MSARSVALVQKAIEKIFPLVYEFRKPRPVTEEDKNLIVEEEEHLDEEELDSDNEEFFFDPDEDAPLEPLSKKPKHDSSHLTKKYKGPRKIKKARRPLGKDNECKEDRMQISDGEFDPDDPDLDFWTNNKLKLDFLLKFNYQVEKREE